MKACHFIAGEWREGLGEVFVSLNPATHEELFRAKEADEKQIEEAVQAARNGFSSWSALSLHERVHYLRLFEANLKQHQRDLAETISQEVGKPLWESEGEALSMIQKVEIAIDAFQQRCPDTSCVLQTATLNVHHKPHGVVAVFGPFNFPGHLPNGHIVPALLAGNCVVFKGSELTPTVSEKMVSFWKDLPKGVLNLVQGGKNVGQQLIKQPEIDGLFFTGSYATGMAILKALHTYPEKILALEMGGNNPLVIGKIADFQAAAYHAIQSAFLTTGQRCTCARRLIIPQGKEGDAFLKAFIPMAKNLQIGSYKTHPEPFMGPVISQESAKKLLAAQESLKKQGGISLLEMRQLHEGLPFLSPGIMDVTAILERKDEELFGPFLQVIRVPSFEKAIEEANKTSFGLVTSIFTDQKEQFNQFYAEVKAGVINWNTPTTGASSKAPFGGVKKSGNFRPSAYYAADYCAYPVASMQSEKIHLPKECLPGVTLK